MLPVSAFAMDPRVHAHEMLLGFALAVVAGNQLGSISRGRMAAMLSAWTAARAAFLLAPASAAAAALNALFAALLALQVAPRLFGAAKKLRNQALPAILVSICAAAIAWEAVGPYVTVALFALLMLFMGGRIIAPTVAGQLHRQGERLDARVQPRIEAALIVAGLVAVAALLAGAAPLAAAALAAAGVVAAIRLVRWRLWALRGRPDLLCLASGYAWLAVGLVAFGTALATGRHQSAALHLITVGALGTLTFNVMAQSWLLGARRFTGHPAIIAGTLLLAAATVFRLAGGQWLAFAAACWSAAFAALLALFFSVRVVDLRR